MRGLFLFVILLFLVGCSDKIGIKGELSDATKAQLTPAHERYILLADIQTWTAVASAYSIRDFCSATVVVRCAERKVVIALDEVLSRLAPTVEILRVTNNANELTTYLSLGTTLLLQLQAELARALAKGAVS